MHEHWTISTAILRQCYFRTPDAAEKTQTWLVCAAVDVLDFVQVSHDRLPPVVDVVKRRWLHWQLSPDVLADKYVLLAQRTMLHILIPTGTPAWKDWHWITSGFVQTITYHLQLFDNHRSPFFKTIIIIMPTISNAP